MNLNQIGFSSDVTKEINNNQEVKNFVCSSAHFKKLLKCLNTFLAPVINPDSGRKVKQRYVRSYGDVPEDCSRKPFLIFAPLTEKGDAETHSRIVYLPLLPNLNSVSVCFPNRIVNPNCINRVRTESYSFKNDFDHYVIPIVLSEFINNPQDFLLMDEIQKRINQ
jgi:hypothetical protein